MTHSDSTQYHKHIQIIQSKLSPLNLNKFRQSCFGSFLDLQPIDYHGGLIRLLLTSLEKVCLGERRLSFLINNSQLQLGASEFYFLTGLKFKESNEPPKSSRIHDEIFGGKRELTFTDVQRAFALRCEEEAGTGMTTLKLSMLYLLYGVLLKHGNCQTKVDIRHVHLVDDLDKFNTYPWGRVVYDDFVRCIQSAARTVDRYKKQGVVQPLKKHSLSFILQVWAFEVMPSLSLWPLAIPRRIMSRISPRMLRWAIMPFSTSDDFKTEFTANDCANMHPIRPSDEESECWETWGIEFTRAECARVYSRQPLPKLILDPDVIEETTIDADSVETLMLPAWKQIVTNFPEQAMKADGTKYLLKEIYGKIDEAVIRVCRKDYGLLDLSAKLDSLLHDRSPMANGPSTPNSNCPKKKRHQ